MACYTLRNSFVACRRLIMAGSEDEKMKKIVNEFFVISYRDNVRAAILDSYDSVDRGVYRSDIAERGITAVARDEFDHYCELFTGNGVYETVDEAFEVFANFWGVRGLRVIRVTPADFEAALLDLTGLAL